MTVGLVYGRMREEERLLVDAARRHDIPLVAQHDAHLVLDLEDGIQGEAVLVRSLSATRGLMVSRALDAWGRAAINPPHTVTACMDKAETSLRLTCAGIPTPRTRVAFDPDTALDALDELGYPAVIKPITGSWGRLVSRVRDRDEARQILEHRAMLPNPVQHVYYMQEYIDKDDGRGHLDVRAFVVGDRTVAAVRRRSPDWITNTARGAVAEAQILDAELDDLCIRAAQAVGGGVVAVDVMSGPGGWLVHEVNHTMEFRNSIQPTGIDIPGHIVRYAAQEARR